MAIQSLSLENWVPSGGTLCSLILLGGDHLADDGALSDENLASRAREGDEEAFRILFERHSGLLEARIRKRLPSYLSRRVSIQDVIQETRIVAYDRRCDFDSGRGDFRSWLLGIADRKASEARRKHAGTGKRDAGREVTRGARPDTADFAARGPSPSQNAVAGELAEIAHRALGELPEDYREILRLSRDEELSLSETAERMGRSREAAKKLYGRALLRFREEFDRLRDESDA